MKSKNNRFSKAHEIAKAIRSQYPTYRAAFVAGLAKVDQNGIDKNKIKKYVPIIAEFVKRDGTIRRMLAIKGLSWGVKGTGYKIKENTPAVRVIDLKVREWRTLPTDYHLLEIKQTWNIFKLLFA